MRIFGKPEEIYELIRVPLRGEELDGPLLSIFDITGLTPLYLV